MMDLTTRNRDDKCTDGATDNNNDKTDTKPIDSDVESNHDDADCKVVQRLVLILI